MESEFELIDLVCASRAPTSTGSWRGRSPPRTGLSHVWEAVQKRMERG
ncbi:MAG TPA: hypothetical protein VGO40_11280 [Longimicrobium sp.]|nr:hypothetical protein [Longimicrobium sp.]